MNTRRYRWWSALGLCLLCGLGVIAANALAGTHPGSAATSTGTPVTTAATATVPTRTGRPLAPGLATVKNSATCPHTDQWFAFPRHTTQARGKALLPSGARSVLLCRYNGFPNPPPVNDPLAPGFGLVGHHNVTSAAAVKRFLVGLNRVHITRGGYMCPFDTGADIVAYFRYRDGRSYRYSIDTGGCESVTSGDVSRLGLDVPFVSRMEALTPPEPYGTLRVRARACGGPAPGRCRGVDISEVSIHALHDHFFKPVSVHDRSRATISLSPGRYRVVLWSASHPHPHKLGSATVTITAGKVTRLDRAVQLY